MTTAAIYFHDDAYSTRGPKLMGRNAAGEGFLRGYVQHATAERFVVRARTADAAKPFVDAVRGHGREETIDIITPPATAALAGAGTLYFPASNVGHLARERSLFGDTGWSICGVTHTTASKAAMDGITEMLVAPLQPWDAVICTSRAVHANVDTVLAAEGEYLTRRLGATRSVRPMLPVIPLGIHAADFARDEMARAAARAEIGADESTVVVLYTGRLSFHAKAHPAAMYLALEAARARAGARRVMLVECGWFANDALEGMFVAAGATLCPSVEIVRLDGRERTQRATAWGAADIFCSLADNIQETFGLTPIEAMAAGLPVVVSDWDGYRDTVRDGVDGFRVPTIAPDNGLGGDLAARFALEIDTYDRYCGYSSAFVAVDIAAAADAFARLFASPELRRTMGEAGRARARADYDWRTIIARYEALWAELGAIRAAAQPDRVAHPWPGRMDPFAAFAGYPTRALTPATMIALTDANVEAAQARLRTMLALEMVRFAHPVLPSAGEIDLVIAACGSGPKPAADVVAGMSADRRAPVYRALTWLMKVGVVRFAD